MTTKALQITLIKSGFILLFLLVSCQHEPAEKLTEVSVEQNADELVLKPMEGKWYYNSRPFSGIAVKKYSDGALLSRIAYVDGKKQGLALWWFDTGDSQKRANFKANRLHGQVITWWPNGLKSSESNYESGVLNGVQKRWHSNGQLARKTQL